MSPTKHNKEIACQYTLCLVIYYNYLMNTTCPLIRNVTEIMILPVVYICIHEPNYIFIALLVLSMYVKTSFTYSFVLPIS